MSYLRIESSPGDYIGQGKNYAYEKDDLVIRGSGQGIRCQVGDFSNWTLNLSAGQNRTLDVGEYRDAKRQPFSGESPGIEFSGNCRGSNTLSGEFRIWELEMKGDQVIRLAVDFVPAVRGEDAPARRHAQVQLDLPLTGAVGRCVGRPAEVSVPAGSGHASRQRP